MSAFRLFVVCALLSLLVACEGIGKGNKPRSLVVLQIPPGQNLTQAQILDPPADFMDFAAFSCVGGALRAFVIFDDDSVGDFSDRVRWSSNSDALRVSNADLPTRADDGTVFSFGALVPSATAAAGTATITAQYLDLRASVDVAIRGTGEAIVEPAFSQVPFGATVRPAMFRMAPGSLTPFRVRRMLDGRGLSDVTSTTTLSIQDDDEGTVADFANAADTDRYGLLASTGTFNAVDGDTDFNRQIGVVAEPADDIDDDAAADDQDDAGSPAPPLTVLATPQIPGCAAAQTVMQVTKIAPGDLTLDYQKDFYPPGGPTGHLVERGSQRLRLIARFVDDNGDGDRDDEGEYQDLGSQFLSGYAFDRDADGDCDVADLDPPLADPMPAYPEAVLRFGSILNPNFVNAVADTINDDADEPTLICARYGARPSPGTGYPAIPGVLGSVLPLTVIDGPLTALSVAASDPCTAEAEIATLCTPLDPPITDPRTPSLRPGQVLRFTAMGTFKSDGDEDRVQPITELVDWTSSDTARAVIGPAQGLAPGQLVTLADALEGTLDIVARFVRDALDTVPPTVDDDADEVVTTPLTVLPAAAP